MPVCRDQIHSVTSVTIDVRLVNGFKDTNSLCFFLMTNTFLLKRILRSCYMIYTRQYMSYVVGKHFSFSYLALNLSYSTSEGSIMLRVCKSEM